MTANPEISRKSPISYYPALDGLRGVAILLVVLHHNFDFIPYLSYGWIGVDLFFVLSGFLITEILLGTREQKGFLKNFYVRRALRILPLYYLIVILFFLIVPFCAKLAPQWSYYSAHPVFVWTNTQNWLYIVHKMSASYLLLNHFWSLSLEEQFYLFWPVLILLMKSKKLLIGFLFVLLLAGIALRFWAWRTGGTEYWVFQLQEKTRIDGLALGCILALWRSGNFRRFTKNVVGFFIVILIVHLSVFAFTRIYQQSTPHFSFLGYTTIAACFSLLLLFALDSKSRLKTLLLENRWMIWIGKISYGLYVYHWIILALARLYFTNLLLQKGLSYNSVYITLSVSALPPAIAVSWISYEFFEKKILALKTRFY